MKWSVQRPQSFCIASCSSAAVPRKHRDLQGPLVLPSSWDAGCHRTGVARYTAFIRGGGPRGPGTPAHLPSIPVPGAAQWSSPEGFARDSTDAGRMSERTR